MLKLLKLLGYLMLVLILLVAGLAIFVKLRSDTAIGARYVVNVRPISIPSDAGAIAHGAHLVKTRGCMDCHGADFAGAKVIEDGAMGRLYGTNLTTGRGSAVAGFRDEDWIRAIRHGVGADGRGLFIMPSLEYARLSDEDLGAMIAYLKTLPAVDRDHLETRYGPVSRALLTFSTGKMIAAHSLDHAYVAPQAVAKGPNAEYGRYIAASCFGCHGPNYSGGKIEVGPPDWPLAANLTPHPDSRLSQWTEQDFMAVMRTAKRPDGSELHPVMPRGFGGMDDIELKALWAFFKTLTPTPQGVR